MTTRAAVPAPARDGESFRDRLVVAQFQAMESLAVRLPEPAGRRVFETVGGLLFRGATGVRATVAGNLAKVIGRDPDSDLVQAATREAFKLYARYWFDTYRMRLFDKEEMNRRFVVEGLENIDRALEAGRGVVAALPHMGNWDAAGKFMAANGYPLVAVAEELRPRGMYEMFLRHREALGMRIVPLTSDKAAGLEVARLVMDNWVAALVADRDLGGGGVEVVMFGAPRKIPAGPALLSIRTGAPLLGCCVYTTDDGWFCRIGEPLQIEATGHTRTDVTELTRRLAADFERSISAKPIDWHMFQPAWDDVGPAPTGGGTSETPAGAATGAIAEPTRP